MTVDTEQLSQLRTMRDYIGAALNVADEMRDTLMAALFADIEHSLSERIGTLVSETDRQLALLSRPTRFTPETGYGRAAG